MPKTPCCKTPIKLVLSVYLPSIKSKVLMEYIHNWLSFLAASGSIQRGFSLRIRLMSWGQAGSLSPPHAVAYVCTGPGITPSVYDPYLDLGLLQGIAYHTSDITGVANSPSLGFSWDVWGGWSQSDALDCTLYWHPVASKVALDYLPYCAMRSAPNRLIRMAIEMARKAGPFLLSILCLAWS